MICSRGYQNHQNTSWLHHMQRMAKLKENSLAAAKSILPGQLE
jgi:hypothetical protein